jgi:hypothetical protein
MHNKEELMVRGFTELEELLLAASCSFSLCCEARGKEKRWWARGGGTALEREQGSLGACVVLRERRKTRR